MTSTSTIQQKSPVLESGAPLATQESVGSDNFPHAVHVINSERSNFPLAFCPSGIPEEQIQKIQDIALDAFPRNANTGEPGFERVVYRKEDLNSENPLPSLQSRALLRTSANWGVLDEHILPALEIIREKIGSTVSMHSMGVCIIPKDARIGKLAEQWHTDAAPNTSWTRTATTLRGPTTEFCALPMDAYAERELAVGIANKAASSEVDALLEKNPNYHLRSKVGEMALFKVQSSERGRANAVIPKEGDVVHKAPPNSSIQDVRIFVSIDVDAKEDKSSEGG